MLPSKDVFNSGEWRAFVAAFRANPDDDVTRLAAADWLDEQGEADRAELIRLQLHRQGVRGGEGTRLTRAISALVPAAYGRLARRLGLAEPEGYYARPEGRLDKYGVPRGFGWGVQVRMDDPRFPYIPRAERTPADSPTWFEDFEAHRVRAGSVGGAVVLLTAPAATWVKFGDELVAREPIGQVRLATWPAVDTWEERNPWGFAVRLAGRAKWAELSEADVVAERVAGHDLIDLDRYLRRLVRAALAKEWPGVDFVLPAGLPDRFTRQGSAAPRPAARPADRHVESPGLELLDLIERRTGLPPRVIVREPDGTACCHCPGFTSDGVVRLEPLRQLFNGQWWVADTGSCPQCGAVLATLPEVRSR